MRERRLSDEMSLLGFAVPTQGAGVASSGEASAASVEAAADPVPNEVLRLTPLLSPLASANVPRCHSVMMLRMLSTLWSCPSRL